MFVLVLGSFFEVSALAKPVCCCSHELEIVADLPAPLDCFVFRSGMLRALPRGLVKKPRGMGVWSFGRISDRCRVKFSVPVESTAMQRLGCCSPLSCFTRPIPD